MRGKKYVDGVGVTGATTLRLIEGSQYSGQDLNGRYESQQTSKRCLYVGDSWFGSVKMAEALKCTWSEQLEEDDDGLVFYVDKERGVNPNAHEVIGAVKTAYSWFPKDQLEEEMKDFPSGSNLVMECTAPETGVKLVAIGYKYNSRKVLLFVMTKNAGNTMPGSPYIARFTDDFGNVKSRKVERPDCISQYFRSANRIDRHNHLRQGILRLEHYWRTNDPWLRLVTTVFGMTVVDCFLGLRFHLQTEPYSRFTIDDFANMLANDLLTNPHEDNRDNRKAGMLPNIPSTRRPLLSVQTGGSSTNVPSSVPNTEASPTSIVSELTYDSMFCHEVVEQAEKSSSDQRPVKRKCAVCGNDTRSMCGHPACRSFTKLYRGQAKIGIPLCKPSLGCREGQVQTCLEQHICAVIAASRKENGN